MKIKFVLSFTTGILCCLFITNIFFKSADFLSPNIYYSLDKYDNDKVIINLISNSQRYIYFAIYTFTKDNIANALIEAKKRGIIVSGIIDSSQVENLYEKPIIEKLKKAGILIETQKQLNGLMHIKAIVSDNTYAMGSYNWTESATVSNDELLEVGTDKNMVKRYLDIIKTIIIKNKTNDNFSNFTQNETQQKLTNNEIGNISNKKYSYIEAPKHIGETAIVEGIILNIYKSVSGIEFLDFCKNYKNCPFSAVIFSDNIFKFNNLSDFKNSKIEISGLIKGYNGKAEIILNDLSQISKVGG